VAAQFTMRFSARTDRRLYVPLVTRGYLPLFRSGTKITPS
jgi:hypothetical protein